MPEPIRAPVPFIVGSGRCGSTLMRVMFDAHPDLAVPVEVYFPIPAPAGWSGTDPAADVERAVRDLERRPWYPKLRLEPGAVSLAIRERGAATYPDVLRRMYETYAAAQGKTRYGNKSPLHVAKMPQLAEMFPEARFIHIVRDGRNVALSYLDNNFGPSTYMGAVKAWRTRVMRGRRAGLALGSDRYREVRYEDLLDDPEGTLRDLCAFVDLDYDDGMLRYYERIPTMVIGEGPHRKLSKPPTKGLRDWRRQMEPWQVALFESIAADALVAFGYEPSDVAPSVRDRVRIGLARLRYEVPARSRRTARRAAGRVRGSSRSRPGNRPASAGRREAGRV